ncbi:hypothetical protein KC19_11G141300 [Ceratodon purpureus]|uniref:UGP3-like C-terminal hexapeptide repeats domain-containing protein n=1 Tax=Ceratodon purpureus TaxID=3225 RepID=A0A8T0GKG5_CERPU|nr:hypothetical protein KC19_11G141300 [Ceratodon purpureus]
MEVSSLGVIAREPLASCTSVLWGESLSGVASRVRSGNQNIQRKGQPIKLKIVSGDHTVDAWGLQSRVPNEPQTVPQNGSRHLRHALSTAPVARPIEENVNLDTWRLDDEIRELKSLMRSLKSAPSYEEKTKVLDNNRRVWALFGGYGRSGIYVNPVVDLAMRVLSVKDLFHLKCMIASGQDHVLDIPSDSLAAFFDSHEMDQSHFSDLQDQPSGNPVKDAFSMLANLIKSWDKSSEVPDHIAPGQWIPLMTQTKPTLETEHVKAVSGASNTVVARYTKSLTYLVRMLERMEKFYDSIGGIIGYQVAALELIKASELEHDKPSSQWTRHGAADAGQLTKRFSVPYGPDLAKDPKYANQAASWGLEGLADMAEIYPLGGAGDRLGLVDEKTGECLPVAMLPYCGRTLLEGLIRDLQAREYLHYKVYGVQHITPVAIMTSPAKKNNARVHALCESLGWFGRGKQSFRLFEQPLVPTVGAADARWMVSDPLRAVLKPGGHGVIWKLASDEGVFKWFAQHGRKAAIVRQISNPMAGVDTTLLALSGIGLKYKKKFGFASCRRNVGAAEGVNVLTEQRRGDGSWEYAITCIEYTEFSKLGISDVPVSSGSMEAQYPANTNVLYVDLASVERIASSQTAASLPGMIMNLKKPTVFYDQHGLKHSVQGGRIECTMQNIADLLVNRRSSTISPEEHDELGTYVIYNDRRKVTSSAKRRRKPNEASLHQTPDGSFLDVTRNAYDLLRSCGVTMPEMLGNHCYVDNGPPFIVLLHPALGPIWDVVRQKIRGGSIAEGSELQLEIAEFSWRDVKLDGSLVVQAANIMGSVQAPANGAEGILQYGTGCGRCRLHGVEIRNKGVDWHCNSNVYWQHQVHRLETIEVILHGNAEFEAFDVVLEGAHRFEVPNGHCMRVTSGTTGLSCTVTPLAGESATKGTWFWDYEVDNDGQILLNMVET